MASDGKWYQLKGLICHIEKISMQLLDGTGRVGSMAPKLQKCASLKEILQKQRRYEHLPILSGRLRAPIFLFSA